MNTDKLTFWNYFKQCMTTKYCCFKGRARRKELISFLFFYVLLGVIIAGLYLSLGFSYNILVCIAVLFHLIFLLPGLSVYVRRFHDIGWSGWFVLLYFLPLVNCIVTLLLIFTSGQKKANKYGNVPKGVKVSV